MYSVSDIDMEDRNFINKEHVKREFDSYAKFAFSGNFIAMALTLLLANTAQRMVSSISESLLMPFINYMVNETGGNWRSLVFVPFDNMEFEVGKIVGSSLEFIITSVFVYILYVKVLNKEVQEKKSIG